MKRISFVTVLLTIILSACAPATPTVDPAQIQASAVSAANTMVALTQAAIPTETPVPPTQPPSPTPQPSPTLLALPTLSILASPTAAPATGGGTGGTGGDPCNAPLSSAPAGPKTTLRIVNGTKASITLSLYLYKTVFAECGYRGYTMGPSDSLLLTDLPQGCYFGGALINDPKKPSKSFGDQMCMNNDDKWTMTVGTDVIRLQGP